MMSNKLDNHINESNNNQQKNLMNFEENLSQIKILQSGIEEISNVYTKCFNELKTQIYNDINDKNKSATNSMFLKINEIISKFKLFDEKLNYENEINVNSQKKINEIDSNIKNNLNEFKKELNNNKAKIDFIEKQVYENNKNFYEDINQIKKNILNIQNEFNQIESLKLAIEKNFKINNDQILNQEQNFINFTNKVKNNITNIQNSIENFESKFHSQKDFINNLKEDLLNNFELLNNNLVLNYKNFTNNFDENVKNLSKEINNFEKHIINEQNKFNKFIQEKFSDFTNINNKNLNLSQNDLNDLKKKYEYTEILIGDMKKQFYTNLNESEEFLTKKYDRICRALNNQHLLNDSTELPF
jgi:hypothetical protein